MKKFAFGFDSILKGTWGKEGEFFALHTLSGGLNSIYLLDLNC